MQGFRFKLQDPIRLHPQIRDLQRLVTGAADDEPINARRHGSELELAAGIGRGGLPRCGESDADVPGGGALPGPQLTFDRPDGLRRANHDEFSVAIGMRDESCALQETVECVLSFEAADNFRGPGLVQVREGEEHLALRLFGKGEQSHIGRLGGQVEFHGGRQSADGNQPAHPQKEKADEKKN